MLLRVRDPSCRPQHLKVKQTTNTIIMVSPTEFCANPEAGEDNFFIETVASVDRQAVQAEAGALRALLIRSGVNVIEIDPSALPAPPEAPDGCFPNNWLMFVDGRPILCPMKAKSRRRERTMWPYIANMLRELDADSVIDLSSWEEDGLFLEGTGSLVLDRVNRIAFAAISERTHLIAAERVTDLLNYQLVAFVARDPSGRPIYHTNVLMSIGTKFAVVCSETIAIESASKVRKLLGDYREVIEITWDQVTRYCGNVLELSTGSGSVVAMSRTANQAFSGDQLDSFSRCGAEPICADITTIERVAGGSVRCMLAEVF